MLSHEYEFYFRSWRWYEKGFLPTAGTWFEQPAHWVQAIEIIAAISAQKQAEQLRDMQNGARDR